MDLDRKQKLLHQLLSKVEADLKVAVESAKVAADAATHAESRPENKYDTRGLEASYLAGAQNSRILELRETREQIATLKVRKFNQLDKIEVSAVVTLKYNELLTRYFLVAKGAGYTLNIDGVQIVTLSPLSPLGRNLVGKLVGDFIEVSIANELKEYEILALD